MIYLLLYWECAFCTKKSIVYFIPFWTTWLLVSLRSPCIPFFEANNTIVKFVTGCLSHRSVLSIRPESCLFLYIIRLYSIVESSTEQLPNAYSALGISYCRLSQSLVIKLVIKQLSSYCWACKNGATLLKKKSNVVINCPELTLNSSWKSTPQ